MIAISFAGYDWAAWVGLIISVSLILVSIFYYNPKIMLERKPGVIEWIEDLIAQGKLASHGPRLAMEGKVLKAGGIIRDGLFVEIKEQLGSFIIVKAESLDEAVILAHGNLRGLRK